MKSKTKNSLIIVLCLIIVLAFTGCGKSDAEKAMDSAAESANALLDSNAKPYDASTKKNLKKAVAKSEDADSEKEYTKVTKEIKSASKAYQDSIKQLKQVTKPKQSFLLERAKKVDTITSVEAATEKTDPNNLINKDGAYYAYIAMKSSMVEEMEPDLYTNDSPLEAGNAGGAVIEAFKTVKDAKNRSDYLASLHGPGLFWSGTSKVVGTLVVRTSEELTASQEKKLEKDIIKELLRLDD